MLLSKVCPQQSSLTNDLDVMPITTANGRADCSVEAAAEIVAGTILQRYELASVMAAACKAMECAMNIAAPALVVAGSVQELPI